MAEKAYWGGTLWKSRDEQNPQGPLLGRESNRLAGALGKKADHKKRAPKTGARTSVMTQL
jgi:hypothetical protein